MNKDNFETLEKNCVELKKKIKMKITEIGIEDYKKEDVIYYKDESEFISHITPLPIEQNKEKNRITGYDIEPILIILLAIALIAFKLFLGD